MYWTNSATSKYRKSRNSKSRLLSSGSSGILEWRTGSGVMRAESGGAERPMELLILGGGGGTECELRTGSLSHTQASNSEHLKVHCGSDVKDI